MVIGVAGGHHLPNSLEVALGHSVHPERVTQQQFLVHPLFVQNQGVEIGLQTLVSLVPLKIQDSPSTRSLLSQIGEQVFPQDDESPLPGSFVK